MYPKRLSILGVGLLGGSIGLACRAAAGDCKIVGYGHRAASLEAALSFGVIDEAHEDPLAAVRGADLVVLCTPVGMFDKLLRRIAGALEAGAVVTDVGSTKRSVVKMAHHILPTSVRFVGSHPMAGSERRGVEFARADLFQNATCLTTPIAQTDAEALELVEGFWKKLGMRIVRLSPQEHDRQLADISHLPHALAAALVMMQDDIAMPLAGKGFLDTTRIAGGDGVLWRDIFHDNRDNVRSSLKRLRRQLDHFLALLERGKSEELAAFLNAAASRREQLLRKKLPEVAD